MVEEGLTFDDYGIVPDLFDEFCFVVSSYTLPKGRSIARAKHVGKRLGSIQYRAMTAILQNLYQTLAIIQI